MIKAENLKNIIKDTEKNTEYIITPIVLSLSIDRK